MSSETLTWLRDNIRYGFTDERGPAWWRGEDYMADGSHFPAEVPEEEVHKLLDVRLVEGPVSTAFDNVYTDADGEVRTERVLLLDPERKHILRVYEHGTPDAHAEIMGTFKNGYQIHGYNEWINLKMQRILGTGLQTACVALLKKGAMAFHQVKLPEQWEVEGFKFTPWFTGATSCDGSTASIWFTGVDAAVCDNTFEMARQGAQTRVSARHTSGSLDRLDDKLDELGLTLKAGEEFAKMVEELTKVDVSDEDFRLWLDEMKKLPEPKSADKPGRGWTLANNYRETLEQLWNHDPKVAPWKGTAFGIVQLDNTYRTHLKTVQNTNRFERNLVELTLGHQADEDRNALAKLKSVQERKLVLA